MNKAVGSEITHLTIGSVVLCLTPLSGKDHFTPNIDRVTCSVCAESFPAAVIHNLRERLLAEKIIVEASLNLERVNKDVVDALILEDDVLRAKLRALDKLLRRDI